MPRPSFGRRQAAPDDNTGFTAIFDGKSLDGWDGDPKFWTVEDGAITGRTTEDNLAKYNTFMIWQSGKVGDLVPPAMAQTPWGRAEELRGRKLPPGRGRPRGEVEENQRQRLYGAMVALVNEKGYAETTISDLAAGLHGHG